MKNLIGLLNAQQWKVVGSVLFAGTGPVAWILSKQFGLNDADTKMWLEFLAMITPVIGTLLAAATQTNAAQAQAVAAMPDQERVKALAAVPPPAQAAIAAALPDATVVAAAGAMPGVEVLVDHTAPPGARAAAHDENVPGVNPA